MARAADARMPKPILNTIWASQIQEKINRDFPKFGSINSEQRVSASLRGQYLDNWSSEFLNNPKATIVRLACRLDSCWLRLNRGAAEVHSIDVDMPDAAALCARIVSVPEGDYKLLASDVTGEA
ncbi:hypothetical protein F5X99DRAFT_263719 [Biscogniauxia marginata]|nr:hypothetical protein F5X99DRAFT_263719 [Biscogniauxia marginata]